MSFKLTHDPDEWDGTFSLVLATLVNDLLDDGPFKALVNYQVDILAIEICRARGMVTGIEGHILQVDMGGAIVHIEAEHVTSIELA